MATRTNENATSHLGRIRDRIRSTLFAGREGETAGDGTVNREPVSDSPANPDAPGNLFHCSTCGTVYIDSEKSVCSHCDEDVEQVPSTLESSVAHP